MMKFAEIWAEFDWVVDELRDGMAFFEGYIPSVRISDIAPCLQEFSKHESVSWDCDPCWANESDIPERGRDYSISECVGLFSEGKLASFDFRYEKDYGWMTSQQKLMFMPENAEAEVIIICFAEAILGSKDPKKAVALAIEEMREIKSLLNSDALYIGPDGLDVSTGNCLRID